MIRVGNKIYDVCQQCGGIVRINKPIVGSMHLCLTEEENRLCQTKPGAKAWLKEEIAKNEALLREMATL